MQDANFKGYAEARAVDKAGNVSDSKLNDGYVIDEQAPTDIVITSEAGEETYESDTWTSKDVQSYFLQLLIREFTDITTALTVQTGLR